MFIKPVEAFLLRRDHPPRVELEAIYAALIALQVGEIVPPEVYIKDYSVGTIPEWTVKSRELKKQGYLVLVLIDPNGTVEATLWEPAAEIARDIHSAPDRCLATQPYQLRPGYGPKPMFCDLLQQARYVAGDEKRQRKGRTNDV